MKALRKLVLVGALIATMAGGGLWLTPGHSHHEKLFRWLLTPRFAFSSEVMPPPPDYHNPRYWAESQDSAALESDAKIPLFFLHQTSLRSPFEWNQNLQFPDATARYSWTKQWQTQIFHDCCLIFAPFYRQATFASYWQLPDGFKARNLAYRDVREAFETFVARDLKNRPFILAGHSQGAEHGLRLIKEVISATPLAKQLVVAYLIGMPISLDTIKSELPSVPICDDENQVGCIVNYLTFRRGFQARPILQHGAWSTRAGYEPLKGSNYVCVNPLNWRMNGNYVSATRHMGSTAFPGRTAITSAECVEGTLVVDDLDDQLEYALDGNYHLYDLILFSENLRHNSVQRVRAFQQR